MSPSDCALSFWTMVVFIALLQMMLIAAFCVRLAFNQSFYFNKRQTNANYISMYCMNIEVKKCKYNDLIPILGLLIVGGHSGASKQITCKALIQCALWIHYFAVSVRTIKTPDSEDQFLKIGPFRDTISERIRLTWLLMYRSLFAKSFLKLHAAFLLFKYPE